MKNSIFYQFIILSLAGTILITIISSSMNSNNISAYAQDKDVKTDSQSRNIETISTDKGYELIQKNKENADFVIIDVRTPGEYADGHIENAVNIDFLSPTFNDDLESLDKSKTYVIHCRSGGRSSKALLIMDQLDFQNAYDMGGIIDWEKKGYPVVK